MRLLVALEPHLSDSAPTEMAGRGARDLLELARSQLTLFQTPFWPAGGPVLLVGMVAALLREGSVLALAFLFLTPLLAAAGVAYAFRPETRTLWELERLTPVPPLALLYARLLLVLSGNALLALGLLVLIWLQGPQLILALLQNTPSR